MIPRTFKHWLRSRLEKDPNKATDQAIKNHASKVMKSKVSSWNMWLPISGAVSASLLIVWVSLKIIPSKEKNLTVFSDPVELVRNYEDIELMVEASQWTEEDWKIALIEEDT